MTLNFFSNYSNPKEAFLDEDLAKLGDTLVNLIYSLGRSIAQNKPDGAKAPNKVLSESLDTAGLRDIAPSRVDKHQLGDVTEAIIAYAWLQEKIKIKEAAEILAESLKNTDFNNRKKVLKAAETGFKNLLTTISERISYGKNHIP